MKKFLPFKYGMPELCPDVANHVQSPRGYLAHCEWADEKRKTHKQRQCPTCGFWVLWDEK